jgi:hypothetical protein
MRFKGCISGRVVKSSLWGEATLSTTSGLLPGATFNDVCYNTCQIIRYCTWVRHSLVYASVWMTANERMGINDGIARVCCSYHLDFSKELRSTTFSTTLARSSIIALEYAFPWYMPLFGWQPMKEWESMMWKDGIARVCCSYHWFIFGERGTVS